MTSALNRSTSLLHNVPCAHTPHHINPSLTSRPTHLAPPPLAPTTARPARHHSPATLDHYTNPPTPTGRRHAPSSPFKSKLDEKKNRNPRMVLSIFTPCFEIGNQKYAINLEKVALKAGSNAATSPHPTDDRETMPNREDNCAAAPRCDQCEGRDVRRALHQCT